MGSEIHPSAVIDPSAEISEDAEVGPFVIIEEGVKIGRGTRLMAHAFIGKHTVLGEENVVHPGAVLGHAPQDVSCTGDEDTSLIVGDRNVFREYSYMHRGSRDGSSTTIGNDNFLMAQCHVAHDCHLGNNIILASGTLLAGHIDVEDRAFISGNCAVHQFCRIGTLAMIAGLSRVSRDAPPYFMLKGDSQICGLNKVGLQRAGISKDDRLTIRKAYKILYRRNTSLEQALRRIENTFPGSAHTRHLVEFIRKTRRGISPHHRRGAPRD